MLTFAVSCGQQKTYVKYTVKRGETMRVIAKDLDMTVKDLLRLNPNVGRRPKAYTNILIPNTVKAKALKKEVIVAEAEVKDSIIPESTIKVVEEKFLKHTLKQGDTFYNLARLYGVSETDLLQLNPYLSRNELKIRTEIKIKRIDEMVERLLYKDTIVENRNLKVALLLPFRTAYYDTIASEDIFVKKNRLINIVSDFYLGATFAIDSLQKQGVSIALDVFDTERKNSKIRTILEENDLSENDVIIGPLYSDEVKIVANKVNVPIVFPVYSKNQSQFSSASIIKTLPDNQQYKDKMLDYLQGQYTHQNIIVISDSIRRVSGDVLKTISVLQQYDSIAKITVIEPKNGYIEKEVLINALQPSIDNWVILETADNVIAADAINSLISLPTEQDIEKLKEKEQEKDKPEEVTLQALPEDTVVKVFAFKKGNTFDKIANTKLSKLYFTYGTDVFSDENSSNMEIFNRAYTKKNYTFPSYYAIKGFDITYDVLMRLTSGKELKLTFKEGTSFRLQSQFDFNHFLFETSENNGVFIMQYNADLSLTRLKE